MLILGKISFGVLRIASPPLSRIKIASTINVYGLRNARLTIHIAVGYLLDLRFRVLLEDLRNRDLVRYWSRGSSCITHRHNREIIPFWQPAAGAVTFPPPICCWLGARL